MGNIRFVYSFFSLLCIRRQRRRVLCLDASSFFFALLFCVLLCFAKNFRTGSIAEIKKKHNENRNRLFNPDATIRKRTFTFAQKSLLHVARLHILTLGVPFDCERFLPRQPSKGATIFSLLLIQFKNKHVRF